MFWFTMILESFLDITCFIYSFSCITTYETDICTIIINYLLLLPQLTIPINNNSWENRYNNDLTDPVMYLIKIESTYKIILVWTCYSCVFTRFSSWIKIWVTFFLVNQPTTNTSIGFPSVIQHRNPTGWHRITKV